jgi:multimeric flavodoxin WrbA
MKIALVLFSHMGHTRIVGEVVANQLKQAGHQVRLIELQPKGKLDLSAEVVEIEEPTDMRQFEGMILATPVHGGRMSAPVRAFLDKIPELQNMPTVLLLTHFFKKEWGANQAIQRLQEACNSKYLELIGFTTVKWFSLRRKSNIRDSANKITELFAIY